MIAQVDNLEHSRSLGYLVKQSFHITKDRFSPCLCYFRTFNSPFTGYRPRAFGA